MPKESLAEYPEYSIPWKVIIRFSPAFFQLKRQSFHDLAIECTRRLHPSISIINDVFIPTTGPSLILVNHYYRPGFHSYWIALAISAIVPIDIHWIMTSAWTYPNKILGKQRENFSRWVFNRIAKVFGFTLMPPMPPRPWETAARASAVRQVLNYAKKNPQAIISMAPEGRDSSSGSLELPAPGVGRFLYQLNKMGFKLIPVGIFEQGGSLNLKFGPPFQLNDRDLNQASKQADFAIRQKVMHSIADCLPPT